MQSQPFQSIDEIKEFLENSTKEERENNGEQLKRVAPLFKTNLYSVVSRLNQSRKDIEIVVDTYFDYNIQNNFGKEKVFYDSGDGISYYLTDRDVLVDEIVAVYSLLIDDRKIAIATKQTTREKFNEEKDLYLTPQYLKTVRLNLLNPQTVVIDARKSRYDDEFYGYYSSKAKTTRLKGANTVFPLYVARKSDAHKAVINCPRLNTIMWQIVDENAEKMQERKTSIIIKDIKYRKLVLKRFCEEAEMIKEDLKFEEEMAKENNKDKKARAGVRARFEEEIKEKEEYKAQEKELIATLHNEVKTLKTQDAKQNLGIILR